MDLHFKSTTPTSVGLFKKKKLSKMRWIFFFCLFVFSFIYFFLLFRFKDKKGRSQFLNFTFRDEEIM